VPLEVASAFFSEPRNLERLMPRIAGFRLVDAPEEVGQGSLFRYRMALGQEWVAEVVEWNPPYGFADLQLRGPYAYWRHRHTLAAVPGGSLIVDSIEYRLRGGAVGALLDRLGHRLLLRALFAYRRRRIEALL
jgi:ligand-binding SRPBCC domain-containing protein